jgi:hypothetical protein
MGRGRVAVRPYRNDPDIVGDRDSVRCIIGIAGSVRRNPGKIAAGLILAVLIVAAITAYAVLRKKYVRFAVFDDRIERIDLPRSVRTAEKLKEYTVVAGVFSSSLTTVATGILMQTQDHTSIKWRSVTSAEMYSNRIRITCKGNEMTIPCTDELCARLAETIGENVAEHKIVSKE